MKLDICAAIGMIAGTWTPVIFGADPAFSFGVTFASIVMISMRKIFNT